MSDTLTVGVVGPSFWSYTAAVMAEHLRLVALQRVTAPEQLLMGVYLNAKRFFRIVLEDTEEAMPANPCASIANYKIAVDTLLECIHPQLESRAQIDSHLRQYAHMLERLQVEGSLTSQELAVATELRDFFAQLAQDGEEETYLRAVRFDPPEVGIRHVF